MNNIINGSHFWTLLLLYKYLKEEPGYDKERTFFTKDLKYLNKELEMKYSDNLLNYDKKYIFIDDASYHGKQLSNKIDTFIRKHKIDKSSILPIILFYHNKSTFKYNDKRIIGTEMINPFYITDKYNEIFNEIDLVVKLKDGNITTLTKLLGINEYNLPVIFEYNLGNSYNTYTCLFEYGPIFNNIKEIYNDDINITYDNSDSNSNWDNYCDKVIDYIKEQSNSDKFISTQKANNNNIENIKIFDLPEEFNLEPIINSSKYKFCDKSSFIKKAYGIEYYDSNSIKFINIFDNINFIYDKNKDEIAKINTTLTDLIKN